MKFKLIGLAFVVFLTLGNVSAQPAPPEFPDLFYGEVTVNGGDAPAGEKIVTKVGGEFPGQGNITIETAGEYGSSDGAEEQLAVADSSTGEAITFFIQEYDGDLVEASSVTPEVDYRAEGDIRNVNLSFQNVQLTEPSDGGSSLSVSVDDVSVDEGETVDLESSVSSEGSNPVYSWSIIGEDYGSFISDSDSQDAVFEASGDVSSDREVEVELTVTKDGGDGDSDSDTGIVTIFDSSESDSPSGGAPPSDQEDQPGEDEEPSDDQPVEKPETVDVEAQVDEETGSASGSAEASEGQTVTVSIPEQADEDVTGEVEGQEAATEVESVSATASGDTIVSVSVSSVSTDEVEQRQDNQVSYSNIEVDGEVSSQAITFSVRKSVLEERNASFEQVVKERYSDGSWEQLDTTHLEELDNSHRFEAETSGNSIFAVAIQEETSAPDEETDPGNETVEEKPEKDGMGVLPWIIGLLAILAAGAVYFKDEIADFAAGQVPDSTEEEEE